MVSCPFLCPRFGEISSVKVIYSFFFLPTHELRSTFILCSQLPLTLCISKFVSILEVKRSHIPHKYALNTTFWLACKKLISWLFLNNAFFFAFCCIYLTTMIISNHNFQVLFTPQLRNCTDSSTKLCLQLAVWSDLLVHFFSPQ